jgi:T5SS/PEP-CTERM-associated repeat protein
LTEISCDVQLSVVQEIGDAKYRGNVMSSSTWTWLGGTINVDSASDWTLTAGPGNPTGIPETGDTAINNGTLVGYGLIAAALINNGTVEASNNSIPGSSTGGDLEIQGSVSGTGSMTIAPGATLQIGGTLGTGQAISFEAGGAPETLILGSPTGTVPNPIAGFAEGDRLEFSNGITTTSASLLNGNTLAVTYHNAAGSVGVYDLTDMPIAVSTPLSFVIGLDPATNDESVIPTTFLVWDPMPGSTDFSTAANWNLGTVVPSVADYVNFNNGVGGTISGTGTVEGFNFYNTGTWYLAPGTSLTAIGPSFNIGLSGGGIHADGALTIGSGSTIIKAGGAIYVAGNPGNVASLTVSGGGLLQNTVPTTGPNYAMYIGIGGASGTLLPASGSVVVTGLGSLIDLTTGGLSVGALGGSGNLTVQQGGSVIAGTANSALNYALAIGEYGNGTVTVTDPRSELTSLGNAYLAHTGTGTLVVENFGTFMVELDPTGVGGLTIGAGKTLDPSAGPGVGGAGVATVTADGVLDSVTYVNVGSEGDTGQLSVHNGGTVEVGTDLTVGPGGTLSNGVTEMGNGTLTIGADGTVELTGTAQTARFGVYLGNSNIGTASAENAVATVSGTGAVLNTNGNGLAVANYGTASLTVSQGGSVGSGTPNSNLIVALAIGKQGGGAVTVTDLNSQLTADGGAFVGRAGTGSLIVENHGSVIIGLDGQGTGGLSIGGFETTSTGILYVGGTGTALVNTGGNLFSQADIDVGQNGATGTLTVQGGTVGAAGQLLIGTSITLAPGATLISPTGTTTVTSTTVETGTGVVNVGTGGIVQVQGLTEDASGSIVLTGGSLLDAASGSAAGTVSGFGMVTGQLTSDGAIVATGGTLDFTGGLLGNGGITIDGGAALQTDSLLSDSQSVTFATSASTEDLMLGAPQATNAFDIANWQDGDEIVFTSGATVTNAQWLGSGTLEVDSSAGTMDFTNVGLTVGALPNFTTGSDFVELVPCFVTGTRIATPAGEMPVEHLSIGDKVLTLGGEARPIVWIGAGRALATRGRRNAATPVIVRKGALADNGPHRDLRITKGHSLCLDGVLIPAEFLVNHRSILWDDRAQEVEVYHIELATHDALIADGAPAESYRDDGNRWLFQNANSGWDKAPQEPCAPVLTGGDVVDRVWRRLLDRAGPRPGVPLTNDPDLHLLVDNQRLDAAERVGEAYVFHLRAVPSLLRIASRAAAPAELGLAPDPRMLGVALRRLVVRKGTRFRVTAANDDMLADGFHAFEVGNGFRWTAGEATIPTEVFAGFAGPIELGLQVGATSRYLADEPEQRVA